MGYGLLDCSVASPFRWSSGTSSFEGRCSAAAAADGSCPFKLVLVSTNHPDYRPISSVYSWENGRWSNRISTEVQCVISPKSTVLIGHCLYWLLPRSDDILEFDLDDNSLTVIGLPPGTEYCRHCQIIEAEDGVIGFVKLSYPHFQSWQRSVNAHGVATWVPWKTIEMCSIPGLG